VDFFVRCSGALTPTMIAPASRTGVSRPHPFGGRRHAGPSGKRIARPRSAQNAHKKRRP